jgi:type II secretory pathway pseudopilin PulG
MRIKNKAGVTLIENLVSIVLLSIVVIATIGGFVIAKTGATRAQHRTVAMGLIREYMNKEISSGYYYGQYYTFSSGTAVTSTIDGITYSTTPEPYPATDNSEGSMHYKTVGFCVRWDEPLYGGTGSVQCSERAATYIAKRT